MGRKTKVIVEKTKPKITFKPQKLLFLLDQKSLLEQQIRRYCETQMIFSKQQKWLFERKNVLLQHQKRLENENRFKTKIQKKQKFLPATMES